MIIYFETECDQEIEFKCKWFTALVKYISEKIAVKCKVVSYISVGQF